MPQLLLPQLSPGTGFTHCGRGHQEGLLQTCSKRGLGSPGQSQAHLLTALTFPPFLVSFLCNLQTTQSKNRKGTLGPGPSRVAVPFGLVLHWFGQWLRGCHAPELWGCREHVPTRPGWPRVGVHGPVTVLGLWVGSPWPAARHRKTDLWNQMLFSYGPSKLFDHFVPQEVPASTTQADGRVRAPAQ